MMDEQKKKIIFTIIVTIAMVILIAIGSTFAYFTSTVSSNEDAISFQSAVYQLDLIDDVSLNKTGLIPSAEIYVDRSTIGRLDENKDFIKPYESNGETVIEGTTCIDDNLNEICSIYTFTIQNPMTDLALPIYVTLNPKVNTFENLYFKVLDEDKNVVIEKTHLIDSREYTLDANGDKVYAEDSKMESVTLTNITQTLPKATKDATTGEIIPSKVTYSIVLWVLETGKDQTKEDSAKIFTGGIVVNASGANGQGITGTFGTVGVEEKS